MKRIEENAATSLRALEPSRLACIYICLGFGLGEVAATAFERIATEGKFSALRDDTGAGQRPYFRLLD